MNHFIHVICLQNKIKNTSERNWIVSDSVSAHRFIYPVFANPLPDVLKGNNAK